MTDKSECKGCRDTVRLSEGQMAQIFSETLKGKDVKPVSDDIYEKRLKTCGQCEALLYGTTCRYCGCLMPVKAKLYGAKCPHPGKPKWS